MYVRNFITEFIECKFISNTAHSAAVRIHMKSPLYFYPLMCHLNVTKISNCQWEENTAQKVSAIEVTTEDLIEGNYSIFIMNSNFLSNKVVSDELYGSEYSSCAVDFEGLQVYLNGTNFTNSTSTGVCLNDANATIIGSVSFIYNHGYFGGGLYLVGNSKIDLEHESHLQFLNNKAVYGGGISAWTPDNSATCCIFFY